MSALRARVDPAELAALARELTPAERTLFLAMDVADQRHSLDLRRRLSEAGYRDPDLLRAALLHDVGKGQARLRLSHRVTVVLGRALWPQGLEWLAARKCRALAWPVYVALRHAELGADAARRAGTPEDVVRLIRAHGGDAGSAGAGSLLEVLRRFDSEL